MVDESILTEVEKADLASAKVQVAVRHRLSGCHLFQVIRVNQTPKMPPHVLQLRRKGKVIPSPSTGRTPTMLTTAPLEPAENAGVKGTLQSLASRE